MKLTYYTIDDLTLPRKKFLRKGWSMKHFDTLEEAIKHYKSLPNQIHLPLCPEYSGLPPLYPAAERVGDRSDL